VGCSEWQKVMHHGCILGTKGTIDELVLQVEARSSFATLFERTCSNALEIRTVSFFLSFFFFLQIHELLY
jgi:hypothetical protein